MNKNHQTVIFLVRHGDTDLPYSYDSSIDRQRQLTAGGREQSEKNGRYLGQFEIEAIYSSPLDRTIETAQVIAKAGAIDSEIIPEKELLEIYNDPQWESMKTRLPKLFQTLIKKHSGGHIICVTHQDVVEGALRALEVTSNEAQLPCRTGDMYYLVFAGDVFVQVTKINVANS